MARTKKKVIEGVKGLTDILPQDGKWWKAVRDAGEEIGELHGFHFIETPILEYASLFESGLGGESRIVRDHLYELKAQNNRKVVLRPEGTIPIIRSYLENRLGHFSSPLKAYYYGPMFLYQSGAGSGDRFHQWGFSIIGDGDPVYDAEIIMVMLDFMKSLKIKDPVLKINAVGCKVCRPTYNQKLRYYFRYHKKDLCKDCVRYYEKSPIHLLACQNEKCGKIQEGAPIILDYLCQGCNSHFQTLLEIIEDNEVNYTPDPYFVGDFNYYSKVAFEIFPDEESKRPLAWGGRYDYLSEKIGGRQLQSVGGVIDIGNTIKFLKKTKKETPLGWKKKVFLVAVGNDAKKSSIFLMERLRKGGIAVLESMGRKSLSAQLKVADKSGVPLVLIYGQREVYENTIILRDSKTKLQETVPLEKVIDETKKKL